MLFQYPVIFENKQFEPAKYKKIEDTFKLFDTLLRSQDKMGSSTLYAAAEWPTIADLALAASVATFEICRFPIYAYPFVKKWFNSIKQIKNFHEANTVPVFQFKKLFDESVKDKEM